MTLRYLGGACENTMTRSESTIYECDDYSGVPPDSNGKSVHITITEWMGMEDKDTNVDPNADVYMNGLVAVGDDMVLSNGGERFGRGMKVDIYSPPIPDSRNLVQTIKIFVACSQPLFLNDRFGSVQLVQFENGDQGVVSCNRKSTLPFEFEGRTQPKIFGPP